MCLWPAIWRDLTSHQRHDRFLNVQRGAVKWSNNCRVRLHANSRRSLYWHLVRFGILWSCGRCAHRFGKAPTLDSIRRTILAYHQRYWKRMPRCHYLQPPCRIKRRSWQSYRGGSRVWACLKSTGYFTSWRPFQRHKSRLLLWTTWSECGLARYDSCLAPWVDAHFLLSRRPVKVSVWQSAW